MLRLSNVNVEIGEERLDKKQGAKERLTLNRTYSILTPANDPEVRR